MAHTVIFMIQATAVSTSVMSIIRTSTPAAPPSSSPRNRSWSRCSSRIYANVLGPSGRLVSLGHGRTRCALRSNFSFSIFGKIFNRGIILRMSINGYIGTLFLGLPDFGFPACPRIRFGVEDRYWEAPIVVLRGAVHKRLRAAHIYSVNSSYGRHDWAECCHMLNLDR